MEQGTDTSLAEPSGWVDVREVDAGLPAEVLGASTGTKLGIRLPPSGRPPLPDRLRELVDALTGRAVFDDFGFETDDALRRPGAGDRVEERRRRKEQRDREREEQQRMAEEAAMTLQRYVAAAPAEVPSPVLSCIAQRQAEQVPEGRTSRKTRHLQDRVKVCLEWPGASLPGGQPPLSLSPGGQRLVRWFGAWAEVSAGRSGEIVRLVTTPLGKVMQAIFDPTGRWLAINSAGGPSYLVDLDAPEGPLASLGGGQALAFSPDSAWLAVNRGRNDVVLRPVGTGLDELRTGAGGDVSFAPGGASVAVGGKVLRLPSGKRLCDGDSDIDRKSVV